MMNGNELQMGALLGEINEHGKAALHRFDRLDRCVETIKEDVSEVKGRMSRMEAGRKSPISQMERWLKRALTWLLPLGTLIATGSIEAAARVLKLMVGL